MADLLERLKAALADRYAIQWEIGSGGMATVYLARDLRHDRQVALKVLKPELAAVLGAERFVQEIKTTASLQHPHILPLFDSGEAEDFLFYVMPYVEGETLREKLSRETQLSIEEAVRIAAEVADALDYAHRHNVIHRDIKPENILLQDGRPMVVDFGIALAVSAAAGGRMTETGLSLGTPHYMSPEQATADRHITARSDVYSLGAVLYEMLTGEPPHTGASAQAIILKIVGEEVVPVTRLRKAVPPNVAAAVAQALERLQADRFPNAGEFAGALRNVSFVMPQSKAGAAPRVAPSWRWHFVLGTMAIGVMLLAVGFLVGRGSMSGPSVFDVGLPDSAPIAFVEPTPWGSEGPALAASPDGDFVVYVALVGGHTELWYRSLSADEARPLPGTVGGWGPVVSPDGQWAAFIAGRLLRKVLVDGTSPAEDVAEVVEPEGAVWSTVDEVLVASAFGSQLEWVNMRTGAKTNVGPVPPCSMPFLLNDAQAVLCSRSSVTVGIAVAPLDGRLRSDEPITPLTILGDTTTPLVGAHPSVVEDLLVFVTLRGELAASTFDRARATIGIPTVVQRGLRRSRIYVSAHYGITRRGDLVFAPGSNAAVGRFVLAKPDGSTEVLGIPAREFLNFSVSFDGTRLATTVRGVEGIELWVHDLATATADRLAVAYYIGQPEWTLDDRIIIEVQGGAADHRKLVFVSPRSGEKDTLPGITFGVSQVVDEGMVVGHGGRGIIVLRVLSGEADTLVLPGDPQSPLVSPDRRWLSYTGFERGIAQVFVTPYPSFEPQYKVSSDAASEALWLPDGGLVYRQGWCWYRAAARPEAVPPFAEPRLYFCDEDLLNTRGRSHTVVPDGSILYLRTVAPSSGGYLRVVRGWTRHVREMVGSGGGS